MNTIEFAFLKSILIVYMDCPYNCDSYDIFYSKFNESKQNTQELHSILVKQAKCIQTQLGCLSNNINNISENESNDKLKTATQLNNDSMNMYTTDYFYIIVKGIIYFIILASFIYFYGIYNLLENIKTTASTVSEKAIKVKDAIKNKAIQIKEEIPIQK